MVGGGNSAGQAALFLVRARRARCTLLVREQRPRARTCPATSSTGSSGLPASRCCSTPRSASWSARPRWRAVAREHRTGERWSPDRRCLFVFIGAEPHTDGSGTVALDDGGYILTGQGTSPWGTRLPLETSLGVFAAGDVRSGSIKRVASAVGEGAMAVRLVHERFTTTGSQ